ncbi:MAG: c-type cytochrome [bacterium]|nr:c-type cytochrome [bacterium]
MSIDHDKEFDGIKQADNKMPPWYIVSFIATMVIGVLYLVYYHVLTDWSQAAQYEREVAAHVAEYPEVEVAGGSGEGVTGNPFAGQPDAIAAGAETYQAICAACHKADGSGLIGPNLKDDEWLHGNSELALYDVIMEGRMQPETWKQNPAKGPMPAHKASLGSKRVWEVIAYMNDQYKNIDSSAAAE